MHSLLYMNKENDLIFLFFIMLRSQNNTVKKFILYTFKWHTHADKNF